jgi:methyl-accepting chemotaxis protein
MLELAKESAAFVSAKIEHSFGQLRGFSQNELFFDHLANKDQLLELLKKGTQELGYKNIIFADTEGMTLDGVSIGHRDYFQKAIKGENAISSPLISAKDGSLCIFVGVPVKNLDGQIVGMLLGELDGYLLCEMTADIRYAKTGYAYMKDQLGFYPAHPDNTKVLNMDNIFDQVEADSDLAPLFELEKKMMAGEAGFGQYYYKGSTKFMSYAPVEGTSFSLAVTAPREEVFETIDNIRNLTILICIGFIILSILISYFISKTISDPIKVATNRAMRLAENDFSEDLPEKFVRRKDEIGMLAGAFQTMVDNFNSTLENINSAASQVTAGSKQLSDSSTALAQGATEQASSVEELTVSLEQISAQTKLNADNAANASSFAEEAKHSAVTGSVQMDDMLKAMEDIDSSSHNIAKVIKVIEDIAFQTNILALNAAVEAARAGQHGKGFAVVAEEVRNLAARSASAAKETTAMIESSSSSVEHGSKIARKTADSLTEISEQITKVSALVAEIATASNEQASGIGQINQGLVQISQVVQSNSATSEESAASSEELAGQAEMLKEQIMKFKLRRSSHFETGSTYDRSMRANTHELSGKSNDPLLLDKPEHIGKY